MRTRFWGAVCTVSLMLGGCTASDPTSIRLTVAADGGGAIKVFSLAVPSGGIVERESRGADWSHRLSLTASAGTYTALSSVAIADITFDTETRGDGTHRLEVVVPLGPDRRWVSVIAPIPREHRQEMAQVFDPSGRAGSIGSAIKIVLELPGNVLSAEPLPGSDGIAAKHERNVATLTVSVDAAVPGYDRLTWHVLWRPE